MLITPESVLAEVATLAEAKDIARSMRLTAICVETKYGQDHPTSKIFSDRYWNFIDALAVSRLVPANKGDKK